MVSFSRLPGKLRDIGKKNKASSLLPINYNPIPNPPPKHTLSYSLLSTHISQAWAQIFI